MWTDCTYSLCLCEIFFSRKVFSFFLIHLLLVLLFFSLLDLPQNCDPNIPLVAQELMKKMIRQFAIEYISKSSKIQENRNGSSFEPSLICKSIQMNQTENSLQEEQDSPLDLTVNRTQEQNTQQGKYLLSVYRYFHVIYHLIISFYFKNKKFFKKVLICAK